MEEEEKASNREKKVAGRAKRRRFKQGTRSYLHAMTNSVARRARETEEKARDRETK
jgi:hypothetical protein